MLFTSKVAQSIADNCSRLKQFCVTSCEEWKIEPLFAKCKDLEHVECKSDESDITTDYIQKSDLQVLAANTNGNITTLLFNAMHCFCSDDHWAELLKSCPKLDQLQIMYGPNDVGEVRSLSPECSNTVKALQAMNKTFSRIELNWLSKQDQKRVNKMMAKGCVADFGDDNYEWS